MQAAVRTPSLFSWYPFLLWESAESAFEAEGGARLCAQPLESALPAAVEAAGAEDPAMEPSGFTHWF